MRKKYREALMPDPLSKEEIEAQRKVKLDYEKLRLLRDYDDSSDEDDELDYKKVPRRNIREAIDYLGMHDLVYSQRTRILKRSLREKYDEEKSKELESLLAEREEIRNKIDAARDFLDDNPTYVMEIEGRREMYMHLREYRRRKTEALGLVDLNIEGAPVYDLMLVTAMKNSGIITEAKAEKWKSDQAEIASIGGLFDDARAISNFISMLKDENSSLLDAQFFTEENKFRSLRKILRQTNREVVDPALRSELSEFARTFGGNQSLSDDTIKNVARNFASQLPAVRRPVLGKMRVNPDITSVDDFYAEELLHYRSAIRTSRETARDKIDLVQNLVFSADEELVSQKRQVIHRDKKEDRVKDGFAHRGTVKEEVLNLGTYSDISESIAATGFDDQSAAIIIRETFKNGPKQAFDTLEVDDKKLSEVLSLEQKQLFVDIVELLFGTESFRSPAALVETNMALDLIIQDPQNWSFERAFTGKAFKGKNGKDVENGGDLSFTMKGKDGHDGGIANGRALSKSLDETLSEPSLRAHKYGGPSKVKEEDFKEYKSRKEQVAQSWVVRCTENDGSNLESKIQKNRPKWYGGR
jgi:hypothetical protein